MQIEAPQANNQSYEITTLVRYRYTFTITNKKPTLFQPQRMDEKKNLLKIYSNIIIFTLFKKSMGLCFKPRN